MKQKANKTFNIKLDVDKVFKVKLNRLNRTFKPRFEVIPVKQETPFSNEENDIDGVDF